MTPKEQTIQGLQRENAELRAELKTATSLSDQMEQQLAQTQSDKAVITISRDRLSDDAARLHGELEAAEQHVKILRAEAANLQAQLQEAVELIRTGRAKAWTHHTDWADRAMAFLARQKGAAS